MMEGYKTLSDNIIKLKKASKYFETNGQFIRALQNVSLSFSQGEFVAVTGESGSGKSTLLNVINGLINLDEGDLYINGKSCFACSKEEWNEIRRNRIGFIYQEYDLIEHFSVQDNLIGMLRICGYSENLEEMTIQTLNKVGLLEYKEQRAGELSSGQKQRLAIARAIVKSPDVILADEPTGNLDAKNSREIMSLLQEISKTCLVIMVTHNFEQAKEYVTRKIEIQNGSIVGDIAMNEKSFCKKTEKESEKGNKDRKACFFFAWKSIVGNKIQSSLTFILFCIVTFTTFFSVGQISIYQDDRIARNQNDSIFAENENNRILVKNHKNEKLTKKDLKIILDIPNVVDGDLYGILNDILYSTDQWEDMKTITSVSGLNEKSILKGNMPKKRNEVAVSRDLNLNVGEEIHCKFYSQNYWGRDEFIDQSFKVVGIMEKEKEKIFFSMSFCDMLANALCGSSVMTEYAFDKKNAEFQGAFRVLPMIMDQLEDNQVMLSEQYDVPAYIKQYYENTGEPLFSGKEMLITEEENIDIEYAENYHKSTPLFLGVNRSLFMKCYKDYGKNLSPEISIHITNYGKTDRVIRALKKQGYDAVNTYRVCAMDYNQEKVSQRMETLGISIGTLFLMFFVQLLIHFMLLRLKDRDCVIFCKLGMEKNMLYINLFYEQSILFGAAVLFTSMLYFGVFRNVNESVSDMCNYYSLAGMGGILIYNIVCALAAYFLYKKYVHKMLLRKGL